MKELKHLPIVFDAKAIKDDGSFEGYASTFGNVDSGYDVVMPGAFKSSLAARPASSIKMLWQHDPTQPIGYWTQAAEDEKGLFVKGVVLKEVRRGAEARALMKAGVIDSMSIGYKTLEADFLTGGVRQLKEDFPRNLSDERSGDRHEGEGFQSARIGKGLARRRPLARRRREGCRIFQRSTA
jgi:HK97 family phage prohead protease